MTGAPAMTMEAQLNKAAVHWEKARRDPLLFLHWFVRTADQHDRQHPCKSFPAGRPHIQHLVRLWQENPLLVICKSRQMLQTWLFVALALWDCMFHPGRLVMLQSKRLDDAIGDATSGDGLLGRAKYILRHIPRACGVNSGRDLADRIIFPEMGSTLWAIPQGSAIIRQRTASGILSDEAAFQDEFEEAYAAGVPAVRDGGWFVALSTPFPGFFQRLYEDTIQEARQ